MKLEITKPRLSGKLQYREELSTAEKLADLTENRHRKTTYSASRTGRTTRRRNMPGKLSGLA